MSGHGVEDGVLDGIAATLQEAGGDLDEIGRSVPDPPDAGEAGPAIVGIVSQLVDNAGQLVLGLKAMGEAIAEAGVDYADYEVRAAEELEGAATEGE
ncbi:hypothetical protein SAMN06265360_104135 [Haloechinothrix alba]|uniref:Uncharacterized protein n=1 Tax=Haloechinothrix alba TaxID=664784 RepID=A0A238VVW6_9PSEU|nr:hypothetical protein [Haloechinothrix alba]SNR38450.1 hypothetical protein SAMN06265360_104135 [Haloechinothrix alba]